MAIGAALVAPVLAMQWMARAKAAAVATGQDDG
jgi:hypothetical protein